MVCVPPLEVPLFMASITPPPLRLVSVLFEMVALIPVKFQLMPVICAAPVVILLNVLLLIFLLGPVPTVVGPSELLQHTTAVAPVKVTLEKLFSVSFSTAPMGDEDPVPFVPKVTVPPALVLAKPVTMELLLILCAPAAL